MQLFDDLVGLWANGETDSTTRANYAAADAALKADDAKKVSDDQAYRDYTKYETGDDPGPGKFSPAWKAQVDADEAKDNASEAGTDSEAFDQGWSDAVTTDRNFLTDGINKIGGGILGVIPWQVWIVLLGAVAFIVVQETGGWRRFFKK